MDLFKDFEPHQLSAEELARRLQVDPAQGLLTEEVRRRLAEQGPNELLERSARTPLAILWDQLSATMVLVLLAAAAISFALRDSKDAIAILAIVVLNAALGFAQEYRAEKAMAALKKLAVPSVTVRRDGQVQFVPARDLVRGDVLCLEEGNLVGADCRLLESESLYVDEASLTGESMPVEKFARLCLEGSVPLAERRNMVYLGTAVREGRATAVVTHTGMQTELGRIAGMLQQVKREPTPLQRRLDRFGVSDSAFAPVRRADPRLDLFAVSLTLMSMLAILYVPFLQRVFGTRALSPADLLVSLILSTAVFWSIELEKLFKRRLR